MGVAGAGRVSAALAGTGHDRDAVGRRSRGAGDAVGHDATAAS